MKSYLMLMEGMRVKSTRFQLQQKIAVQKYAVQKV